MGGAPLTNIDRDVADEILKADGLRASHLGLRFDRVALSVLGALRTFVEASAPADVSVLFALTAPIRLPAKTVEEVKHQIGELLSRSAAREDACLVVHGNAVRLRLLAGSSRHRFVGLVHNPASPADRLLDLAEQWLRGQADER